MESLLIKKGTRVVMYENAWNSRWHFGEVVSHTKSGAPRVQLVGKKSFGLDGNPLPPRQLPYRGDIAYLVQPDFADTERGIIPSRWSRVDECWKVRLPGSLEPSEVECYDPYQKYRQWDMEY